MTVRQFLRNLQTHGAFIAAITSEKRLVTKNKKSLFRHWPLIMNFFVALKGSHTMADGRIFLKNRRASSFNRDLSNEPNFG
jgi:hypothetical protein